MTAATDQLHTPEFLAWRREMFGPERPDFPNEPTMRDARSRIYDQWREEIYNGCPHGSHAWNVEDWREYTRLLFDDAWAAIHPGVEENDE